MNYTQEPHTNINSFVYAGFAVYIDVAHALAVAQYRNTLGCPLDVPDQLGRAPWNDQVNQLVQSAQILNFFTCAHLHAKVNVSISQDICVDHVNHVKTLFYLKLFLDNIMLSVLPVEWHLPLHEWKVPPE